ncbi:hypothetical protein [Lapillicoccus jejuensis]|uniref:O-antigen ligase-like membrane protein n=1 Tax=Lapillicoccus jejuensis TaxID=402171 RepID=A0A542DVZ3_9MICO|nr:hypothetical protein [Lapillicoccus jejuensis]TQJ07279.1 hypothetical protein FB458_0337 [Lapillicoccus jejuensis]
MTPSSPPPPEPTPAGSRRLRVLPARAVAAARGVQLAGLAYVLLLPVSRTALLALVLALVLASSLVLLLDARAAGGRLVARELRWALLLYVAFLAAWTLWSALRHAPGLTHQLVVWGVAPAVWVAWALTLRGEHVRRVVTTIVVGTLVSGLLLVWWMLHAYDVLPFPAAVARVQGGGSTLVGSALSVRWYGLSAVGLATPVVVAALAMRRESWAPSWRLSLPASLVATTVCIGAGRRAFLLTLALTVLLLLVVRALGLWTTRRAPSWRSALHQVLALAAVAALLLTPLGSNTLYQVGSATAIAAHKVGVALPAPTPPGRKATPTTPSTPGTTAGGTTAPGAGSSTPGGGTPGGSGGTSGDAPPSASTPEEPAPAPALNEDDAIRADEAGELAAGWHGSPVLGRGLGAVLPDGYRRNEARPWDFELQYAVVLMNVGVVGSLVLAACAALVLLAAVRAARRQPRSALVAGAAAALGVVVANATNPYLQAPGHQWTLFLGAGVANGILVAGHRRGSDRPASAAD